MRPWSLKNLRVLLSSIWKKQLVFTRDWGAKGNFFRDSFVWGIWNIKVYKAHKYHSSVIIRLSKIYISYYNYVQRDARRVWKLIISKRFEINFAHFSSLFFILMDKSTSFWLSGMLNVCLQRSLLFFTTWHIYLHI